jgi:hypothetical protein
VREVACRGSKYVLGPGTKYRARPKSGTYQDRLKAGLREGVEGGVDGRTTGQGLPIEIRRRQPPGLQYSTSKGRACMDAFASLQSGAGHDSRSTWDEKDVEGRRKRE